VNFKSTLLQPEAVLPSLEGKPDFAAKFAELLVGYLLPPADGEYTFWIAADDEGEFWLGEPGGERAERKLCSNPFYADRNNYRKFPSQKSAPVRLEKGKVYPLKVLHANGHMGSSVSVAWTRPGSDKPEIIGAPHLSLTPDGKQHGVRQRAWGGVTKVADLVMRADYPDGQVRTAGGVLTLNGKDQFIELQKDVADQHDITIRAKVNWQGKAGERIFEFFNAQGDSVSLMPCAAAGQAGGAGDKCVFAIRKGGQRQTIEGPALPRDKWVEVTVVLAGEAGTLRVDGAEMGKNTAMTLHPEDIRATQCYLGRGQDGGYFTGRFDLFEVYSVAVTK
jgi:hypothetical protein